MKLLFTRSTLLGGKEDLITWGLEEPVSHFAIEYKGAVAHSSWSHGVDILPLSELLRSRRIIFEIEVPATPAEAGEFFNRVQERINRRYDFKFFFWLVWRGILKKIFRIPVPDKIEEEHSYAFLCTEILELLPDSIKPRYDKTRATTPFKLYTQLGG